MMDALAVIAREVSHFRRKTAAGGSMTMKDASQFRIFVNLALAIDARGRSAEYMQRLNNLSDIELEKLVVSILDETKLKEMLGAAATRNG